MHNILTALVALTFSTAAFTAPAAARPSNAPAGVFGGPVLVADGDENDPEDNGNGRSRRNQNCTNPAGHQRGWCRNQNGNRNGSYGGNYSTISGTVLGIHDGYVADFRMDNGERVQINERALQRIGAPLQPGAHYTLNGYFANNGAFVAQTNNYGGNYPNNGYPNGAGSASIRGVVTSVNGNRVTLLQGVLNTITIDDQQALNNGAAQNIYVGRTVTAYGFWSGNVFYASSIA